jgi:hypothetical protein
MFSKAKFPTGVAEMSAISYNSASPHSTRQGTSAMLKLATLVVATLFAEMPHWDPASVDAIWLRSAGSGKLPEEPSALVLALIGIGILGAYAGLHRWRRPQQTASKSSGRPASGETSTTDRPKRGAA